MTEECLVQQWRLAQAAGRLSPAWAVIGPSEVFKSLVDQLAGVLQLGPADVITVAPEPGKRLLEIKQLGPWLAACQLAPRRAYQLAVCYQADRFSPPAAAKLLKTLEEPPRGTIFLLLANQDNFLPTIRSRLQLAAVGEADIDQKELPETLSAIMDSAAAATSVDEWPATRARLLRVIRRRLRAGQISPNAAHDALTLALDQNAGLNRRLQLVSLLAEINQ